MVVVVLGLVPVMWQSAHIAHNQAMTRLRHDADNELRLSAANLTGYLSRHDYLPHLLASRESVQRFLSQAPTARDVQALNRLMERSRIQAGVSDIYLLDRQGTTVAASNWQRPDSFIGHNYAFRGYYRQAINGQRGHFHGLGTQSRARGYYFSAPAWSADSIPGTPPDGVLVIKVLLDDIEREWQSLDAELMVTDINGVVFMASTPVLRMTTLQPLSDSARRGLQATRRYADEPLLPASIRTLEQLDSNSRLVRLAGDATPPGRYLGLSRPMPRFNWSLHILKPLTPVIQAQWLAALGAGGLYMLVALMGGISWQRQRLRGERERFAERERQTLARARDELERNVARRTEDLVAANRHLSREIDERRRIEESLRQTRDELVQAARMAVLGQMAASINHELNQPLTAIRAYADNACVLLARDRPEDATVNLRQISVLVERMAAISAQLRQFSRKSGEILTDVSVQSCFDYALRLFRTQLHEDNVTVTWHWDEDIIWTRADPVRLEQVLVNLIGNALQAMSDTAMPQLILDAQGQGDRVVLSVADNGPGLPMSDIDHLFEPFFTTKPTGQGLGLGLSISQRIITDLGGRLEARNRPEGGALFLIYLPVASGHQEYPRPPESTAHA